MLVTNNQSDLDVELALKLVEIMRSFKFQAVAHAFSTHGEAIACSVCKAATCSNADTSVEVLLIIQNYALLNYMSFFSSSKKIDWRAVTVF